MPTIYLALGTNLGDRAENLRRALAALPPAFTVEAASPIYETAPMYVTAQPNFLNMACRAQTALLPLEALRALKLLETALGREADIRFGPRLIDLDLLFYEDLVFQSPELALPHPRLHERAFVLVPLADIAPDFVHPVLKQTISALRDQLGDAKDSVWLAPLDAD
jgi:2-amino-4-hydroxy-6-hydroxymethyldihydropteridine diphosphokinase